MLMTDFLTFTARLTGRLAKAALVFTLAALPPSFAMAQQGPTWPRLDAAKALVGDTLAQGQPVKIDLPLVSEDGSSVPLTLTADQPLGDGVFIKYLDIFAPGNPTPEVASFELGPELSPLNLALRVRLSESQTVVVVARTSDGRAFVAERAIRITTSGCIAGAGAADASGEMKARVRLPKTFVAGQPGEVVTLLTHPMVTGLVADAQGNTPAQRIVNQFDVTLEGAVLLKARFYRSLAANPYLRFMIAPKNGGSIVMAWTEDTGRKTTHEATVNVAAN